MSNHSRRAKQFAALGGGAIVIAPMLTSGHASAGTAEVQNLNDSGAGSLRQLILDANTAGGADTITFKAGLAGTITLTSQLVISDDITIVGPGANVLTISGNDASRVFYADSDSGNVTLSALTIHDGHTTEHGGGVRKRGSGLLTLDGVVVSSSEADLYGGGVYITDSADLLVENSTVSGNTASYGGGIYAEDETYGYVKIIDSVISGNDGGLGGGGLYFNSTDELTITRSQFLNNTATGGGAAEINVQNATITDSSFSGNVVTSASKKGGALYIEANTGDVIISGCTFSGNSTTGLGGAIGFGTVYGDVDIVNSTLSGNSALYGGGIYVDGLYDTVSFTIAHSTITGNESTADDPRYNGGGGVYLSNAGWSSPGDIVFDHTVVSGNTAVLPGDDISALYGGFVGNFSMIGNLDGFTVASANDLPEGDAKLGPLADNGGLTKTHLPLAGSPLLNAGDPLFSAPPDTDQRGLARVSGGRIDVGAVEVGAELPPTGSSSGALTALGAALLAAGGAMHLGSRRHTRRT